MTDAPLTPRQQAFVLEYLVDLNATQAAIRAGYSPKTADRQASRLLSIVKVQAAVAAARQARSEEVKMEAADVLRQWIDIATSDANDLQQVRHECCRYCHGIGHRFQWIDPSEFAAALSAATVPQGENARPAPLPDDLGGYGFVKIADPNPGCPQCHGEGIVSTWVADTRRLKGGARRLYSGVKHTRDGIQILTRDQDRALEMIARHLGMLPTGMQQLGKDGKPTDPVGHLVIIEG